MRRIIAFDVPLAPTLPWRGRVGALKARRGGVIIPAVLGVARTRAEQVCDQQKNPIRLCFVTPPRRLRRRPSPSRGGWEFAAPPCVCLSERDFAASETLEQALDVVELEMCHSERNFLSSVSNHVKYSSPDITSPRATDARACCTRGFAHSRSSS